MTEEKNNQQPGAWNRLHPLVRIVILVAAAIIGEFIMIILGIIFSAGSSSGIMVIIFALILPIVLIGAAIWTLIRPKTEVMRTDSDQSALEKKAAVAMSNANQEVVPDERGS